MLPHHVLHHIASDCRFSMLSVNPVRAFFCNRVDTVALEPSLVLQEKEREKERKNWLQDSLKGKKRSICELSVETQKCRTKVATAATSTERTRLTRVQPGHSRSESE